MSYDIDYSLLDFGDKPRPRDKKAVKRPQKGVCGKCGKHVGRGVAFHERACKGAE